MSEQSEVPSHFTAREHDIFGFSVETGFSGRTAQKLHSSDVKTTMIRKRLTAT